jgi:hypothetical protein
MKRAAASAPPATPKLMMPEALPLVMRLATALYLLSGRAA